MLKPQLSKSVYSNPFISLLWGGFKVDSVWSYGLGYGRLGIKLNLKVCLLMLIASSKFFFFLNHISYYHTLYLGPPHDVILNILGLEHAYGYPLPSWQKGVPLLPNNGYGNLIPPTLVAKWGTTLPSNGYGSHKTIKPLNITLLIESCTLGFRSIEGSVNYAHHFALRSIHRWIWTKIVSWRYKILIVCFVS